MVRNKLNERLPDGVRLGYGTIYFYSEESPGLIERAAQWKHINRWHDTGLVAFFLMMVVALFVLAFTAWQTITYRPEPSAAQDPANLVAVPGFNEFLPLSATVYIVIALLIGAGVHELGHAIAMRAEDVDVTEIGIGCLLGIPIAAYVQPDEEAFEAASVLSRARILAAGVYMNLLVVLLTSVMFVLPGTGNPLTAFFVYFGTIFGLPGPTPEVVAALGPVTNTLFWVLFFNLNLAFVNALPVVLLDGGRIAGLAGEVSSILSMSEGLRARSVVALMTTCTVGVFLVAVFGPLFF